MQQYPNPYAPPATPEASFGAQPIPEQSVWLMLLLIVVTFGLYVPHWLYTRGKAVNELAGRQLVSMGAIKGLYALCGFTVVLAVVGLGLIFLAPEAILEGGSYEKISDGLDTIANFGTLFAAFHFRSALHNLNGSQSGSATWLSGVATFFFGALYFQYRINRGLLMYQVQQPQPTPYGHPPYQP